MDKNSLLADTSLFPRFLVKWKVSYRTFASRQSASNVNFFVWHALRFGAVFVVIVWFSVLLARCLNFVSIQYYTHE
jgi:hypothetical protein